MLKRQRLQRVVDHLTDAVDIARAMLRDGHVTTARQFLIAPVGSAWEDVLASAKDPDDYPPQHRAQFDAIVAEVRRLAPDEGRFDEAKFTIETRHKSALGKDGWATSVATLTLTEDGLSSEEYCPEMGAISHCGGSVAPDEPPEETARSLLKAAGVQVPR